MTNREFCYWLQGYFELNTPTAPRFNLVPEQLVLIKAHLDLVRAVEKKLEEFPSWLEGIIDVCGQDETLSTDIVDKIKARLNSVFKHEIDPSYKGNQSDLNKIHSKTQPFSPSDTLIRC